MFPSFWINSKNSPFSHPNVKCLYYFCKVYMVHQIFYSSFPGKTDDVWHCNIFCTSCPGSSEKSENPLHWRKKSQKIPKNLKKSQIRISLRMSNLNVCTKIREYLSFVKSWKRCHEMSILKRQNYLMGPYNPLRIVMIESVILLALLSAVSANLRGKWTLLPLIFGPL